MKKLILFLVLVFLTPVAFTAVTTSMKQLAAQGSKDVPTNYHIEADYGARTDGQPEYLGQAPWQAETTDDVWILYNMAYDGNDQMTSRKTAYGTWDDRATYTYR
jgi:hypothetical protein